MHRKKRTYPFWVLAGLLLMHLSYVSYAETYERNLENNIKAAYLYNFVKFVEWPDTVFDSRQSPVEFCVIGEDSLYENLKELQTKIIEGRNLSVGKEPGLSSTMACHIAYIGDSEKKNVKKIVSALENRPILTVSSLGDFAEQGGMIEFVRMGNNIRFKINIGAVRRSGLSISSRLLKLAIIVGENVDQDARRER